MFAVLNYSPSGAAISLPRLCDRYIPHIESLGFMCIVLAALIYICKYIVVHLNNIRMIKLCHISKVHVCTWCMCPWAS